MVLCAVGTGEGENGDANLCEDTGLRGVGIDLRVFPGSGSSTRQRLLGKNGVPKETPSCHGPAFVQEGTTIQAFIGGLLLIQKMMLW